MSLQVYNTLTNKKEEFIPLEKGKVRMYVCGPTVYDKCHIGHARCYVAFDLIRRYLEYKGYTVKYVENFTDVDDKIINKSRETGKDPLDIAERYIAEYFRDMDALNVKRADVYPRATEHITDMISFVEALVEKGAAYQSDGDVYFSVEKSKDYGKLSGIDKEQMKAGARIAVDKKKRDPLDFALWKKAKEGEPKWESPWGEGRPGWHIECSTMSQKHLGETLDIHGGGQDLIFPHHENEIAQSEAYTGKQFVRYWLHNGFVTIKEEKMSKSLGNIVPVEELLQTYSPETLRYFLVASHYRKPIDFTEGNIKEAYKASQRLLNTVDTIKAALREDMTGEDFSPQPYREKLEEAMDDDFNTPLALSALFELARETNRRIEERAISKESLKEVLKTFLDLGNVLGLFFHAEIEEVSEELLAILVDIRENARAQKLWDISDSIRDRLKEIGIVLEDSPQGTRWKFTKK
ncbi:MAG: cysteine--tRNA ligase [Theionarchaea archaeon]|nr:MAG: cysteine--tRNA ligase [Theionarchaea archaeon DG-70]MBU7012301.1 cysteine--tRNA ligase [Theionarchaea archaeon]